MRRFYVNEYTHCSLNDTTIAYKCNMLLLFQFDSIFDIISFMFIHDDTNNSLNSE